jgi:hypothetical protein
MSFYLELKNGKHFSWNVNSHPGLTPELFRYAVPLESIALLQADGHELEFIISCIRITEASIPWVWYLCKWREPWAQFIFDNWLFNDQLLSVFVPGQPLSDKKK